MMNANPTSGHGRIGNRLVVAGLIVALLSAAAMVVSGFGYRLDLWHFRTGFAIIRWAFWFALAGAILSLAGLAMTAGRPGKILIAALAGIAIGMAAAYMPWSLKRAAETLPFIHDISTDTANPPEFIAAAWLRKPGDLPVTYDGPEVADLQMNGYPYLASFMTGAPGDNEV
jgi:hypothetical protein